MVSFPYYSHIFRESYGSGMGIVWVPLTIRGSHVLGGPWKSHWFISRKNKPFTITIDPNKPNGTSKVPPEKPKGPIYVNIKTLRASSLQDRSPIIIYITRKKVCASWRFESWLEICAGSIYHVHFAWQVWYGHYICMGVSKNRATPKWMVKIMENPMNKWMIWGYHYFWKHPYVYIYTYIYIYILRVNCLIHNNGTPHHIAVPSKVLD